MGSTTATATRPFFIACAEGPSTFQEQRVTFTWHKGMSWQVRQRSSIAMADTIASLGYDRSRILEVSTKSTNHELGVRLSAYNLMLTQRDTGITRPVENWFQSSKTFTGSTILDQGQQFGPYTELLDREPVEAKRFLNPKLSPKQRSRYEGDALFERIRAELKEARFLGFELNGTAFPAEPKSAFYDFLYTCALLQEKNRALANQIASYQVFTDIEFNPWDARGRIIRYNTQARSCAIVSSLMQRGLIRQALSSFSSFVETVGYPDE